jgi:hypothetical protein
MNYIRSIRRYWWVVLFGAAVACLTAILLVYHVKSVAPPKLVKKAKPSFTATTELLVDSASGPYLQAPARQATPAQRSVKGAKPPTSTTATAQQPAVVDTKSLVSAANLFPLFVESDAVYNLRRKLVGDIPGTVSARALYSSQATNRFRPSPIPVMQISATAPRPKFAIALAIGTARAFEKWLEQRQNAAKIPANQRIIVRPLHAPRGAVATGGTAYALPGLAAAVILALFAALAVLLDQRRGTRGVSRELRPLPTSGGVAERHERGGVAASGGAPDQPLA